MNADFDGDTVSVHLPLSTAAQAETARLTLPQTLRSPATGRLAVRPTKDALLGLYQLTQRAAGQVRRAFRDPAEAELAVFHGVLDWTDPCLIQPI